MNKKLNILTLIAIMTFIVPTIVYADSTITLKGTIKGANTALYNLPGAESDSDPRAAAENDFVLSTTNGKNYFLTNVPRSVKVFNIGKDVVATAKKRTNGLWVDRFEVLENNKYKLVWGWKAEHGINSDGYDGLLGYY